MLWSPKPKDDLRRKASEIYGAIVTRARQAEFYADLGVPDTPTGRYEMIVLHLFLVIERLRPQGEGDGSLAQAVLETFVTDMDDCLREMGVGDVSVGRRVRRAAAGFYERGSDYREALGSDDPQMLARRLATHVLGRESIDPHSEALAAYVRRGARAPWDESTPAAFPAVGEIAEQVG